MRSHGALAYVDEPLVRYRVHGSNMSNDIAAIEHDMTYAFARRSRILAFRRRYVSESDTPTLASTGCSRARMRTATGEQPPPDAGNRLRLRPEDRARTAARLAPELRYLAWGLRTLRSSRGWQPPARGFT